jgi:hypothetical protein
MLNELTVVTQTQLFLKNGRKQNQQQNSITPSLSIFYCSAPFPFFQPISAPHAHCREPLKNVTTSSTTAATAATTATTTTTHFRALLCLRVSSFVLYCLFRASRPDPPGPQSQPLPRGVGLLHVRLHRLQKPGQLSRRLLSVLRMLGRRGRSTPVTQVPR